MRVNTSSRLAIEVIAFTLLGLYACTIALPRAWRTLNTDFPNYYVTARLAREGVDLSRAYEWIWIQREKDHRDVDQPVIGLVPITPFSTLLVMPLGRLAPLSAKHVWTIFNILLLPGVAFLLARVSGLSILQTAILLELSFPLERNLLFGQYYILLLAVLTAALWAAQRGRSNVAGALIGFAASLKIFPALLVFYFLRKRDWRAVLAFLLTVVASVCVSIRVFGMGIHRTYLKQVLPWTLRGDCLPPFNLASSSLSTVLHRLFVYEPQWNPHPAMHAAWLFPVLHPLFQASLFVPIVLWIDKRAEGNERIALEWSGLLIAALTVSTLPASYHFTVLVLPEAVFCGHLLRNRSYGLFWLTIGASLAIGLPGWHIQPREGWDTLLCVPRLYVLVGLTLLSLHLLAKTRSLSRSREQGLWIAGFIAATSVSIISGLHHQRKLFEDYAYRLPMASDVLLAAHPVALKNSGVAFIALASDGYRANTLLGSPLQGMRDLKTDQLSLAVSGDQLWTEDVSTRSIAHENAASSINVGGAESPSFSLDGHKIAYLRQIQGRKQLFIRDITQQDQPERQLTFPPTNVYESSFLPDGSLVFAAAAGSSGPTISLLTPDGRLTALNLGEARYPAASPDGHWLAFSGFVHGSWNLFVRDVKTGATTRLTDAPCNQIEPAWESDSKTLLYATDCGRALWFTAIARRTVVH